MAELGVQELGGKAEEEKPRCKLLRCRRQLTDPAGHIREVEIARGISPNTQRKLQVFPGSPKSDPPPAIGVLIRVPAHGVFDSYRLVATLSLVVAFHLRAKAARLNSHNRVGTRIELAARLASVSP